MTATETPVPDYRDSLLSDTQLPYYTSLHIFLTHCPMKNLPACPGARFRSRVFLTGKFEMRGQLRQKKPFQKNPEIQNRCRYFFQYQNRRPYRRVPRPGALPARPHTAWLQLRQSLQVQI